MKQAIFLAAFLPVLSGCSIVAMNEPRTRIGSLPTPTVGTNFVGLEDLGRHNFKTPLFEGNGIAYTCRGGHIDTAHIRIAADNVRYIYDGIRKALLEGKRQIWFRLATDDSRQYLTFKYPGEWYELPYSQKEAMADSMALELSQYVTYTMVTWHEVLTWFGYKSCGVFPEFASAFSWEDNYSNIVGVILGARAVAQNERQFDDAMTVLIKEELERLGIQSKEVSKAASEKMRGLWYKGNFIDVDMKERNMDLGFENGYILPTLVPGICDSAAAAAYPAPSADVLSANGFQIKYEIEVREFEKSKILKIVYSDDKNNRIEPVRDLPAIMNEIRIEAHRRGDHVKPEFANYGGANHSR